MSETGSDFGLEQSEVFVAIPSYNHAQFIEKCLRSIISQTLKPKKLLVIDDGSRDGSPAIIEHVLGDCPFDAELIARENRGLCKTLNQALELSEGDYFAYIGSDDFWLPKFLEKRARLMTKRKDAVLGYGHAFLVDDLDRVFGCTADYDDDWANYADGNPRQMLLNGVSPVSSTVFYRRAKLLQSPWNEEARLEDYELYVRLMPMGEFAFDPQALSAWRHHSYNTSKNLLLMYTEVIAAQNRNLDIFGIGRSELERAQSQSTFRYARVLLQNGKKREALRLFGESWRNADSAASIAKAVVQLALPTRFLKSYQRYKQKRLVNQYNTVKI
jgi:alpha-1,3-rhamnosyltransferase